MRIAVLWSHMSGYMNASFTELARTPGIELLIYYLADNKCITNTFQANRFTPMDYAHLLQDGDDQWKESVLGEVTAFGPDALIAAGWSNSGYRYVCRKLRQRGVLVIGTCDNPWHGSLRQHLGVLASPWYLHQLFDALWVPGERAGVFAGRLGYVGDKLLYGLYTADTRSMMPIGEHRIHKGSAGWPEKFLFVGRLQQEKGITDLARAYLRYRTFVSAPWELWVAGVGPLSSVLEGQPGVRMMGFLQPDELCDMLPSVGAFVLASHMDPWGLVIHEMACAALPILCSRQCGSSVELVQEGFNGLRFDAGDYNSLALLMMQMSVSIDRRVYGTNSHALAFRYSTPAWAKNITNYIKSKVTSA
jgi:glycosyltransferase involved in cell wall biosynthesis